MEKFKSKIECIKDAIRQCEEDGDHIIYYCYGGPAHPLSYPDVQLLARLGIDVRAAAGDEIWNREDVWTQAYNFACEDKLLPEEFKKYIVLDDFTIEGLVRRVNDYTRLKRLGFEDFLDYKPEDQGNAQKIFDQFVFDLENGFPWELLNPPVPTTEQISKILFDNITYSGQTKGLVVHGAIDELKQLFRSQCEWKK